MNQQFDFYGDDLADLYIEEFEGDSLYSSLETLNSLSTTQDTPGPLESNDGGKSSCPNHHGNERVDHVCPHPQNNPHQQWENSVTMWQSQGLQNSRTMAQTDERNIWGPITAQNTEASNLSWSQSAAHLSDLAAGAWSPPAKGVMGETAFRAHDQTGHLTNPLDLIHIPGGQAAAQSPGFVYRPEGGAEAALTKNAHQPGTTLTESLVHSQHAFQSAAPAKSNTWPDDMKRALPTQRTSANTVDDSQITPLLPDLLGNPAESEMHGDVHNEGADGTSVDISLGSDKLDSGQFWLMVQASVLSKHPVPTVECDGETSAKITEAQQSRSCPSLERRQCEEKPHGRLQSNSSEPDSTQLDELFGSLSLLENEDAVSVAAGQWDKQASQTQGSCVRRDSMKLMSSQQPHQSSSTDIQNVPGQRGDPPSGPLRHQEPELEGCTEDELVPESKQKGMQTHCHTVTNSRLNWQPPPGLPLPQISDEAGMKGVVDHTKRLKESLPKKESHHPIYHAAAAEFHSAASLPPENVGVAWHASSPKPSCSLEERVVERDNLLPVSGQHVRRNDVQANLKPAETQRAGTERAGKGAIRAQEEEIMAAQARAGSNNVFADCFRSAMARDLSSVGSPRPADLTSNGTADSGGQSGSDRENPRMSLNPGVPDVRPKGSAGTVALTVDTGGPMPDTCGATPGSQYMGTTTSPAESSTATSRHLSRRDATSLSVSQRSSPSLSQFMGDYSLPPLPMQNQTWTEVDINKELFEPTTAWEDALDLLDSPPHRVLLSGMPGSGKRTLARALLRQFESKGILCHVIKTFQEWRDNVGGQGSAILLLDHIFGRGILRRDLLDVWRRLFDIMAQFCKQGKVMLVFTFYPHVLRMLREAEPDCELFSTLCEVRMRNLDKDEKKKMVDRHLRHKEPLMLLAKEEGQFSVDYVKMRILKFDVSGEMFPRCCEKFVTTIVSYTPGDDPSEDELNRANFLEDSLKIFSRPSPVYKDFILQLLNEEEALKEKLIAAFSLLLENVNLADVGSTEVVAKRCRELGFSITFSRVSLHEILMKFSSFLVTEDCQQFINRHAYEGTALALAQRHASIVLQVVDWPFISKRCIVSHRSAPIRDALKPHLLEIKMSRTNPCSEYKALVNRIAQGLQNPDKMVQALQNDALGFQQFVREGLEPVYLIQGDEVLLKILSGTLDSIHKVSLLYWSLLNSSGCMAEWIFKTVHKKKGRHRKMDLVLSAYACCMFTGKSKLLGMFLKYWKQVTSEDPKELLRGSHLESGSITVPLPEKSVIFSSEWEKQCKHLHQISMDPSNGIKISQPPLHLAVWYNNIEVVDLLAEKYPDLLGVTDPLFGRTALHVAARHGRLEILRRLLEHRGGSVSVTAMDNFENSPLHQACLAGQVEEARLLMAAGPELANVRNRSGRSPVGLALAGNHHDIVQLLHEKPAYTSKH